MDRSCLLCIGNKEHLDRLILNRQNSNKKDYMNYLYCIPIKDYVYQSALHLSKLDELKGVLPENETLHTGYSGEECRRLLLENKLEDKWVICGIEFPGCGYLTYDIVFPQGRCEKGETSRETAIREFMEETGIQIDYSSSTNVKFLGFVGVKKEMSVYMYEITEQSCDKNSENSDKNYKNSQNSDKNKIEIKS